MSALEYAILATATLAVFYYAGMYMGRKIVVEEVIEHTIQTLERGNFIKVSYNEKTKQKELIPLDKSK